jgi:hypothetical protein
MQVQDRKFCGASVAPTSEVRMNTVFLDNF